MNLAEAISSLQSASTAASELLGAVTNLAGVEEIERDFLGKRSVLVSVNEAIKDFAPEDRPAAGKAIGAYRAQVGAAIEAARNGMSAGEAAARIERERLDLTIGGRPQERGHLHLITQVQRELEDVFVGLGFQIAEGPEVETDWYNFEALNFPPGHPARAMQDTLYVDLGEQEQVLLRTHTSPVQVRVMESRKPPIYTIMPGRVYRRDTLDARHSPVFHQIEGLVVDEGITLGDLFGTIDAFTRSYFGSSIKARFLPSYFPFTEPSAEFSVTCIFCEGSGCTVCSRTGWIELGGCGMVDPNVFKSVGYDPETVSGFAFGFGLERMAQIRFGVDHVKAFFDDDIRFLKQF